MSRDPWADDWEDDWSRASKTAASSTEIWSRANTQSAPVVDLSDVTPKVAYKPQIQILKRDPCASDANDRSAAKDTVTIDQMSKEARYKEVRERLFGSPVPATQPRSRASPVTQEIQRPVRQSKGPEQAGNGGFANQGCVKVQR